MRTRRCEPLDNECFVPRYHPAKLRLAAAAGIMFLLQTAVIHRISLSWGRPDLICLLGGFLALRMRVDRGVWWLMGLGFLRDMGSAGPPGISMLAFLPALAAIVGIRNRFFRGDPMDILLVFLFILIFSVTEGTLVLLLTSGYHLSSMLQTGLGQSFLSAAIAYPLFFIFDSTGIMRKEPNRV
ncbi:MAG: rod shape-determining protein MreD [Planctomycetota bacterium]